jgi:hypothetical protein
MLREIAVLCAALVVLAAPAATAGAEKAPSPAAAKLAMVGEPSPGLLAFDGTLSTSGRCRDDRAVRLHARYWEWTHRHVWAPSPWRPAGRTRTAPDGSFRFTAERQSLYSVKAVVPVRERCGRAVAALRAP